MFATTRERWGFCALAALLGAVAIAPIWVTRFLPLLDEPNHVSALYIWHELADSDSLLRMFYEPSVAPVSYLLHYGLAYLAAFALGVEAAHKLVVSLYVLAIPAAALCWCVASKRSPWLSLTTVPLAFSISWAYGYHPFNAGVAAFLFGVVAQDALLRSPDWRRTLIASIAAVVCYFGHPLPLAWLWLCTGVLWVLWLPPRSWRALALSVLSLLPSLALYEWQSLASGIEAGGLKKMLGPSFPVTDAEHWQSRVLDFADHALNPLAGEWDSHILLVLLALALVMLAVGIAQQPIAWRQARALLREYRALVLAAVLGVAYIVLPQHFEEPAYLWIARGRLAAPIAFFLLLSPAIAVGSIARWLAVGGALLGAAVPLAMIGSYHQFDRDMAGMAHVLARCPAHAQVLTLRPDWADKPPRGYDVPVYRELASWVQVVHGGFNPSFFERPIPFPFVIRQKLPAPPWRQHQRFFPFLQPDVYGCVLTMNMATLPSPRYTLAAKEGAFALYRAVK
jgi:hypothetical protein